MRGSIASFYLKLIKAARDKYLEAAKWARRRGGKAARAAQSLLEQGVELERKAEFWLQLRVNPEKSRVFNPSCLLSRPGYERIYSWRYYPDGYFSLYRVPLRLPKITCRESQGGESESKGDAPLGLSRVVISKNRQRLPRGSRGITRLGVRRIRSGCSVLSRLHKGNLAFWTTTLPWGDAEACRLAASRFSQLLNLVRNKLRYWLTRLGLPPLFLGVVELQNRGALHVHWVLPTRLGRGNGYVLDKSILDSVWLDACRQVVPEFPFGQEVPACNIQRVRKNPAAYLAKYLSKGRGQVPEGAVLPSSWWVASRELRQEIEEETLKGEWELPQTYGLNRLLGIFLAKIPPVLSSRTGQFLAGVFSLARGLPICLWGYWEYRTDLPSLLRQAIVSS